MFSKLVDQNFLMRISDGLDFFICVYSDFRRVAWPQNNSIHDGFLGILVNLKNKYFFIINSCSSCILCFVYSLRKTYGSNTFNSVIVFIFSLGILFQVLKDTYEILKERGFKLEQRGYVFVKGKEQLLTFWCTGKIN